MNFKKNRLDILRERLKNAFIKLHKNEKEKQIAVNSKKVSENNPFLQILSKDLASLGENAPTYSTSTLKSLFFDTEKLNYDEDTIVFLEVFCKSIENKIEPQTSKSKEALIIEELQEKEQRRKQKQITRRNIWLLVIGISIVGLYIFYIVLSDMGNKIVEPIEEVINETYSYKAEFHPDPAGNGIGITSIDFEDEVDFYEVNIPKKRDVDSIYVFIDYQNVSNKILLGVTAQLNYSKSGTSFSTEILGKLNAVNATSRSDVTHISNLPTSWKLELIEAYRINTHGNQCGSEYEYDERMSIDALNGTGASLPNLDTEGINEKGDSGTCSQGHVVTKFKITNTEK